MTVQISRRNEYGYEYGPFGEVFCSVGDMASVNPFGFSTKYTDSETGRVVTVTTPPPGGGQSAQMTTHYYDALGRQTGLKYPDNTYLTNIYNSDGFLILTRGSRQYPVGCSYDLQGRLRYMTNWTAYPGTYQLTTWNYSPDRGYLTSKVYADSNRVDYTYTSGGKVATRRWARTGTNSSRITTTYSYNKAGDLSNVTYSDGTTPSVTNTYNRLGQLTGVANNGIATTLSYNGAGQLTGESYAGGTLAGLSVSKTYDAKLRLSQVRAPSLVTNAFGYNSTSGRLTTVTHGGYTASYGYTTNSPLVSQVLFKQGSNTRMTTAKSYDKLNRLTGMISTPSGSGQLPFSYGASYNEANQRITVTMNDGSYWAYEYDTLGQIKSAKKYFIDDSSVPGQQFTYTHSQIGNRFIGGVSNVGVSRGTGTSTYQILTNTVNQYLRKDRPLGFGVMGTAGVNESVLVNGLEPTYRRGEYFWKWMSVTNSATLWTNVVVTSGSETNSGSIFMAGRPEYFTYDLDGNMLSDGRWNYTWDAENRLTSMTDNTICTNDVPKRIVFEYDYQGRRIAKKVWNNTAGTNDPIVNLKYLYDGWNLIAELNGNSTTNALVRSYTWGLDASGSMQGAGGVGGLLMVNAGTNGVHFPAYDLNGNVMGLVNAANGNISAKYEYGPFGEVFCSVGDMARANPFQFSTKYTDNETDLVYYGYRYYSPALGRWLSRDPIEERGGINLYAFVNNDPVNKWDKLGHDFSACSGFGLNYGATWTYSVFDSACSEFIEDVLSDSGRRTECSGFLQSFFKF